MLRLNSLFPVPNYLRRPAVGIDLSDHSIKFAEVIEDHGHLRLGRYGEREIPAGVLEGGKILDPEALQQIISSLRADYGFAYAYVSLPEEKAYAFCLSLPIIPRSELRSSIELQLEEYVPLPVAEAVFDYEIISVPGALCEGYDLGVSVLPAELVVGYSAIFSAAQITTLACEVEGHSLARAFFSPADQGTYLIVDIGRSRVVFSIVRGGVVLHTSAIFNLGGEKLTAAISKTLSVPTAEAEQIKIEKGLTRAPADQEVFYSLLPVVSTIRDEIGRLYSYWTTRSGGVVADQIDQVILTGGEVTLPGLIDYFSSGLSVPVRLAGPWTNIYDLNQDVPPIDLNTALRFSTAIGLGLRNYSSANYLVHG